MPRVPRKFLRYRRAMAGIKRRPGRRAGSVTATKGSSSVPSTIQAPSRRFGWKARRVTWSGGLAGGRLPKRRVLLDTDRINEDLGSGGELTKMHVTIGRKQLVKIGGKAGKLLKGSEQSVRYRHQGIASFMNVTVPPLNQKKTEVGGGAYWLHNFFNGTNQWTAPVHIYDITSVVNTIAGTITPGIPGYELSFITTNPGVVSPTQVSFVPLNGTGPTGALTSGWWQLEDSLAASTSTVNQPHRRCLQDWTQAKLFCYGATNSVTEWIVEFIQIKEDAYHPDFVATLPASSGGKNYLGASIAFWEAYAKAQMSHPIQSSAPMKRNDYKVLKTIRWTTQPRLSNETDANLGHVKQLDIFYHMNRICKFDWNEDAVDPNPAGSSVYAQELGQMSTTVHPKARIYMTIRSTNTSYNNNTVPTTAQTPTYDLLLRKKITVLQ